MNQIVWDSSFKLSFKRLTRKNPQIKSKIIGVLELLIEDPYNPSLKAHKLKGNLEGLWACWVEYDCRIIYTFNSTEISESEIILLIDIGSHDEVYQLLLFLSTNCRYSLSKSKNFHNAALSFSEFSRIIPAQEWHVLT